MPPRYTDKGRLACATCGKPVKREVGEDGNEALQWSCGCPGPEVVVR
jgi:hypothetical protein